MVNEEKSKVNFKMIISIIVLILLLLGGIFGIYKHLDNKKQDEAKEVKNILNSGINYDSCSNILENYNLYSKNKYISFSKENGVETKDGLSISDFKGLCLEKFDISGQDITEDFCDTILKINNKNDLKEDYIKIDGFNEIQKKCENNFVTLKFSTGAFFDIDNDFKSVLRVDLNHVLSSNGNNKTDEEIVKERTIGKERLLSFFEITPKVDLTVDDVLFYDNYALINAKLLAETEYDIKSLLKAEEKIVEEKGLKKITKADKEKIEKVFKFKTPKNQYLGIRSINPVSLYIDRLSPKFQILDYDSAKKEVGVKICRVDNENFAKLDILRGRKKLTINDKDILTKSLDKIKTIECKTKNISLRGEKDNEVFVKKEFDFDDLIGNPSRSGLYFVDFESSDDRGFNNRVQRPILFGIVDSHITMKLSRNGEVFFFVNDFNGNPIANQNIRVQINEFQSKEQKWDNKQNKTVEKIYSPLDENILSKDIQLGKTDKNGILKTNLNKKVNDAFYKTFENKSNYKWNGRDNSFFVTSASNTNISYLKSTWNAGIAPENFGYKVSSSRWDNSSKGDVPTLKNWGIIEPKYYAYLNTDRKLYLPGEDVYFKVNLRYSDGLKIPVGESFNLKIEDSNNKEIYNKNLKANGYGSIFDTIKLEKTSKLGYYKIFVNKGKERVAYSNFAVEIFKNPKFKSDVSIEVNGLESGFVKIDKTVEEAHKYWIEKKYIGDFKLKSRIKSTYYNGANVSNAKYTYKIYKQEYYENSWWNDCYYGCFWEPEKEFYSSGEGKLNGVGEAIIEAPVKFESNYGDYKYIVQVSVVDSIGDEISSSNSVVVKLPDEYKKYNPNFALRFGTEKKFYKTGEEIKITGELNGGAWSKYFDEKYILLVKRKDFENKEVDDVRGYKRTITKPVEKLVDVMFIGSDDFNIDEKGNLEMVYKVDKSGEYVFEYSKVNSDYKILDKKISDLIDDFKSGEDSIEIKIEKEIYLDDWYINNILRKNKKLKKEDIIKSATCDVVLTDKAGEITETNSLKGEKCLENESKIVYKKEIKVGDLLDREILDYFTILTYGDQNAKNPIVDDNKIRVFSEKTSYKLGEKARVLIKLPVSKGKILWTIEKQGVVKSEIIDLTSNIFFKEFTVDDTFIPNAYIGVELIDIFDGEKIPEYKVGYTEIVVDKTDKKAFIDIKTDKKTYSPREKVSLTINVKNKIGKGIKSELQVIVVDDSLVSLMGNIDLEVLKKFYKKLPFNIQTSITNIAMLKNYYFARVGIVGGSGYGNFKGGDSAVSSRNIFKNTPYYVPNLVTNENGELNISFVLPDNLTNFRIIVISNSKDNIFGVSQGNIQVRKNIVIEPKVPQILRIGDKLKVGINIFNNTENKINFSVKLKAEGLKIKNDNKAITIASNRSDLVYFDIENTKKQGTIDYIFSVLGDSVKNSDKIEGKIEIKKSPVLLEYHSKNYVLKGKTSKIINLDIPENTDLETSTLKISFSNTKLVGIESIIKSLLAYPYGCIEQTTSATVPNVVVKRFSNIFKDLDIDKTKIDTNINSGIEKIKSMQTSDGGFAYWQGSAESDLHISPYVLRSLVYMKKSGVSGLEDMIKKATIYLEKHKGAISLNKYSKQNGGINDLQKAEIYWALAVSGKNTEIKINLENADRHTLLAYTYGLVLNEGSKKTELIYKNIQKIKEKLQSGESHSRYWNDTSDKAIFTKMLLDYNYSDKAYIEELIEELYNHNWNSYYYSTQAKNNAFMAFAKYLEKYNNNKNITYKYAVGKENLTGNNYLGSAIKLKNNEYNLKQAIKDNKVYLNIENIVGGDLYVTASVIKYPKNIEKVKAYSNKIKVTREIYEIIDETKLDDCNNAVSSYYNRNKALDSIKECVGVYKLKVDNVFKIGKKYKVKDIIKTFSNNSRNITLEDYLPSSFVVFNNKFQTTDSTLKQNNRNWYFDHVELKPEVVFANASNIWGKQVNYEYYFTPSFRGVFTYPPVTAYEMYNPKNRANSEYKKIIVE